LCKEPSNGFASKVVPLKKVSTKIHSSRKIREKCPIEFNHFEKKSLDKSNSINKSFVLGWRILVASKFNHFEKKSVC
jgi:hypothetical protein